MASGIVKRDGNRFDAVYEQPHGGVNSDLDPADIPPHSNVIADGIFIKHGKWCVTDWNAPNLFNFSSDLPPQNYFANNIIQWLFQIGNDLIAVSAFAQAYIYNTATQQFVPDQTLFYSGMPPVTLNCFQIIGRVIYFFDFVNGRSYVYTPGVSFTLNSSYVGGQYCMVLSGYLITANTNQPSDSPAIKNARFNWSAPYQFGQWDPSTNRNAGFQAISEVQDQITGCFAMGNVGYILREQGLTQLTPTGVAIAPWTITPLWESSYGIGCTYPATFAQYGNIAIWVNDNDVYVFFAGSMPQGICGWASSGIYTDINEHEGDVNWKTTLTGSISNTGSNNKTPSLVYTLAISSFNATTDSLITKFWYYSFKDQCWTRSVVDVGAKVRAIFGNPTYNFSLQKIGLNAVKLYSSVSGQPPAIYNRINNGFLVSVANSSSGVAQSFFLNQYINSNGQPIVGALATSGNGLLEFRQEETRMATKPTVRGVIVKAAGAGTAGSGTISVSVNGVQFSNITVVNNFPTVYRSYGEYTGENPQLTLGLATLDGYVVKAAMLMTFEEGEPL